MKSVDFYRRKSDDVNVITTTTRNQRASRATCRVGKGITMARTRKTPVATTTTTTNAKTPRVPASQIGVPKGMKRCTKSGEILPATPEFFYRDKSQHDGLAAWSKASEKAYNKAYFAGLKSAKATKKSEITTPKSLKTFETTMTPERVKRGTFNNAPVVVANSRTRTRKSATKSTAK